jgi:hypothetical protein
MRYNVPLLLYVVVSYTQPGYATMVRVTCLSHVKVLVMTSDTSLPRKDLLV